MGQLIILWRGQQYKYLINTELADHVIDDIVQRILKYYPVDATVDFIELW